MKIALAQFNPTVGDFSGNSARILDLAHQAKSPARTWRSFPNSASAAISRSISSSGPASSNAIWNSSRRLPRKCRSHPGWLRPQHRKEPTGKSIPTRQPCWPTGKILFEQYKMLLPTYDVFDESRYFQPAKEQHIYSFHAEKLGITICEDAWNDKNFWANPLYERDPVRELVGQGAELIVNISASPYTSTNAPCASTCSGHWPFTTAARLSTSIKSVVTTPWFSMAAACSHGRRRIAAQARSFEEDLVLFDTVTGGRAISTHSPPKKFLTPIKR